uniref:LIM domain-binding protein 1-like n=1 Tax=Paramormyrops kingsleyae TaxID=1676925 RepID=A0A3B3S318_9TELE
MMNGPYIAHLNNVTCSLHLNLRPGSVLGIYCCVALVKVKHLVHSAAIILPHCGNTVKLYLCVSAYICIHFYVFVFGCCILCLHLSVCICVQLPFCLLVFICIHLHPFLFVCYWMSVCASVCLLACIFIPMCLCLHMSAYICALMHLHLYVCMCASAFVLLFWLRVCVCLHLHSPACAYVFICLRLHSPWLCMHTFASVCFPCRYFALCVRVSACACVSPQLCVILEPMQELMSRHKTYSLSPRDCLKTCLFQKWQRMVAPPAEPARQPPSKRRKRKMSGGSTVSGGGAANSNSGGKKKSPGGGFPLSSQVPDVMVVGEPTLMGGEFGDEDERLITRLENTQFDAANGIDDEDSFNSSPALGVGSPWNSKNPSSQESKSDKPTSQASQ